MTPRHLGRLHKRVGADRKMGFCRHLGGQLGALMGRLWGAARGMDGQAVAPFWAAARGIDKLRQHFGQQLAE